MQEICSSNPTVVTECCEPNNSQAQYHNSVLEVEVSQYLHYSSGLAEAKCHKTKHYLVVWLKQTKIDIWRLSPQNHISFYKVFFDKKYSKFPSPSKYLWQRLFKIPQTLIFFLILPFSKFGTECCPPSRKGADTVAVSQEWL